MFATLSPTPLRRARDVPVRSAVRSVVKAAIVITAALVALAAVMSLRFGVYAATHHDMPAVVHLFQSH